MSSAQQCSHEIGLNATCAVRFPDGAAHWMTTRKRLYLRGLSEIGARDRRARSVGSCAQESTHQSVHRSTILIRRDSPIEFLLAVGRLCGMLARCVEDSAMTKTIVAPRTKTKTKTQRPPLYKVILLNDDYTPREFVVLVLKAVFRMSGDQAYRVMMTAHQRGACVIAVYTRDVAETKAKEATELGKSKGYPLFFTTEPEQ
jgi:ATP-dependent Clp protease adaptor protein ClpS